MTVEIIDVVQGSDEWLALRLSKRTASEAAAMMGQSPHMSRDELLALKKGWENNPVDSFKQALFDKGHESEDAARSILEMEYGEDFLPLVGAITIDGLELLASFDGLPLSEHLMVWEHKEWNEVLAENVLNGLPSYHLWQLEQQLLVAGRSEAMLMVSDGTEDKRVSMIYESDPERRMDLINGWQQFDKDLALYELTAKAEATGTKEIMTLPVIKTTVQDGVVVSNMAACLPILEDLAHAEMNRPLNTDVDFETKAVFIKAVKAARDKGKIGFANIMEEFESLAEYKRNYEAFDKVLQKMFSDGEKKVHTEKQRNITEIVDLAVEDLAQYVIASERDIEPISLSNIFPAPDFNESIKGKRSLQKMREALDSTVANAKAAIAPVVVRISENLASYHELASGHESLFKLDLHELVVQTNESFVAVITQRIAVQIEAEKKRAEQRRLAEEAEKKRLEDLAEEKRLDVVKKAEDDLEAARISTERKRSLNKAATTAEELDAAAPELVPAEEEVADAFRDGETTVEVKVDVEPGTHHDTYKEPTLADKLLVWGERFNVPSGAMAELGVIIQKHTAAGG